MNLDAGAVRLPTAPEHLIDFAAWGACILARCAAGREYLEYNIENGPSYWTWLILPFPAPAKAFLESHSCSPESFKRWLRIAPAPYAHIMYIPYGAVSGPTQWYRVLMQDLPNVFQTLRET